MRLALCFFVSVLFFNNINAQCDSSFFRYTGTLINGISIRDTNNILAVGDNGYIITSKDGGKNWKNIVTPGSNLLKAIQMPTDSVGYIVGSYKAILKTEDKGKSWFPLFDNTGSGNYYSWLTDLYFFNKDRGCIVGEDGIFISTNDGGRSWNTVSINSSVKFNSITFITDSIGFICGSGSTLYKTLNGGRTWQQVTLSVINEFQTLSKIRFINSTTGFILGSNGLCLKTTDAGITWVLINTPTSGEYYDIYFQNATKGFIVGTYSGGLILQTDDGGNNWNPVFNYQGRWASYYCISADPGKKKIVIAGGGDSGEFLGYNGRNILSTTDTGATYNSLSRNGRIKYSDAFFLNDSTGYITGDEGIALKTSDYGESWKSLHSIPALFSSNAARKIFFLDSLHGFAATDNIYKTSNGGESWTITTTPGSTQQYFPIQMYCFDSLKCVVQDAGTIYKTIDAGSTWTKVATSSSFYRDLAFTAAGKGFAVGYGGKLDVSTDEGTTWTSFNLNSTRYLTGVYFYNNSIGFIGTADSTIFKTTDGGNSWVNINTGIMNLQVRSFRFINASTGYLVGNNNGGVSWIYGTKDGGASWSLVRQVNEDVSRMDGFKTVYVAGGNGLILKTDAIKKPGIPGYIYGPDKACVNDKSSFITGSLTGVNYSWSLSGGGSNVFTANKDTVLWTSPGLHELSVSVFNSCDVSPVRIITTDVILFEPTIIVQDSVLTATEGLTYQWYRNNIAIAAAQGGTSRIIIARLTGSYTVKVKSFYGCTVMSAAIIYGGLICPNGNGSIAAGLIATTYQWQLDNGSGFVNISNNSFYAGTNTSTLQLLNVPSTWYGYKYRCVTSGGTSGEYTLQFTDSWTGAVSTAWENPANWSCGRIPDANTDVVINNGTVVINSNVIIRILTLNPAVNLSVLPGKTLTITH